jgi:hypothetical protein
MAQIIKHRRGSITQLKDVTARISELVVATGSIGDLNGPFLFVGETEGVAGAYRSVSKIYQGASAPTITVGSHGSVVDGTPFYASGNKSLYILSKDGNARLDFTGNIEGNTISNVTINSLTGSNGNITSITGSNGNFTNLTGVTFTSTNSNITSLTSSNANVTNLTGTTLTTTNGNITSLTGSNLNVTNITGSTISGSNVNISNTLKVSSTTDLGGALNVTGNTILNGSVTVTGLTDNRLVIVGSGGLLEDNADLTFDGTKFDIGQGNFQIDTTTGDIRTSGSIVMKGNITVGDSSADNIILAGEVSSSIVPDVHDSFDLGSSSKNWRNLHVSGTAYVNILEAQSISLEGITVFEDLVVSGSSYLGTGGGDRVIVSGSLYNDTLTEKRLVVAGVDGLITDYSGLTFDNGNLNLSGAIEVTNIQGTGSLYLKADKNDSRHFEIYNTSTVDTHIKSNGGLSFFGDDTNYLKIDDSLQTATIVGVNGVIVSSSLQVTGSLYNDQLTDNRVLVAGPNGLVGDSQYLTYDEVTLRAGAFEVDIMSGDTRMSGSLSVGATLLVTGSTTLKDNLSVSGTTTVSGATTLQSSLTVESTSELKGATTMNSTLDVTGSATLKGSLSVSGVTSFGDSVSLVSGNTLYVNHITDYGNNDLDITTAGDLVLESTQSLSVQLRTANDEDGTNYLNVNSGSVNFSTFDVTSGLTHKVLLDNTGSLRFENVAIGITGSLGISGSLDVKEDVVIHRNLYVSGNLELLGSSSYVNISSSQVDLGTNIINLNTYAPFERFAGLSVYDSGSNVGVTGSLLWDSTNNVWIYSHPDHLGSVASARLISGPLNTGSIGNETGLTVGHFPIASGDDHISDSLLTYLGTTLAFNTNKFTVDSSSGDTAISGNFTLSYSGGTDNGNNTSAIMFRNSSNVVGFVSTTETTDVLDGILGYKNSDGALKFSTVIDGGTY